MIIHSFDIMDHEFMKSEEIIEVGDTCDVDWSDCTFYSKSQLVFVYNNQGWESRCEG